LLVVLVINLPGFSGLGFSPDGAHLTAAVGGGDIEVWELATHTQEYSVKNEAIFGRNRIIAISPVRQHFATGGMDQQINI
jgi:hypothetical protein